MKRIVTIVMIGFLSTAGCESLRFAPSQAQKQNAWLHDRTTAVTAQTAKAENASTKLQALTNLSKLQSRAFTSYYGLPAEIPQADTAEQILTQSNFDIAGIALSESAARPDAFEVADNMLELGIGIFALLGGVYGTKAVGFLKQAKDKSQALKEIIQGNELFKKTNSGSTAAFKTAHTSQSPQTRKLVAAIKH